MTQLLFYGGIVLMAGAALAGAVTAVVLHVSKKRLNEWLDAQYGEPRR